MGGQRIRWYTWPAAGNTIAGARVAVGTQYVKVCPGDTITAAVTRLAADHLRLALQNRSRGERYPVFRTSRVATAHSAEIVVETPYQQRGLSDAHLAPIRFTRREVDGRSTGYWNWIRIDVMGGSVSTAKPLALRADGASHPVCRRW